MSVRPFAALMTLLCVSTVVASRADYASIKNKFQKIEKGQVKAGSRVPLSTAELNEYVKVELPKVAPPGIRNPAVHLQGNNLATGRARIDFVKLRSAQGKPPNWFLKTLLQGEHEISVTARVESGGGKATVHLEKVDLEGIPISGSALDFLVQNYLLPNYPDAKIGKPFALNYKMDRLEVAPGTAWVVMQ